MTINIADFEIDIQVFCGQQIVAELMELDGNLWTRNEWESGEPPNKSFRWQDEGELVDSQGNRVEFSYPKQ